MTENIEKLSSFLSSKFTNNDVLLLVGGGTSRTDLESSISKLPWSAIYTTRVEDDFADFFLSDGRTPWSCDSRKSLSGRTIGPKTPPIIHLIGDANTVTEEDNFLRYGPRGKSKNLYAKTKELLDTIPSLLDYTNHLVITGLNSEDDIAILDMLVGILLDKTIPGSVSFWGMGVALEGKEEYRSWLKALCSEKSFAYYITPLESVLASRQKKLIEDSQSIELPANEAEIFYYEQKPARIEQDAVLSMSSVGSLLTERMVNWVRPLGRDAQRQWFWNFLELSGVDDPQWYGYLRQSDFHVKRDYEDTLVNLVRRALKRQGQKESADGEPQDGKPIILSGHPCTSKSVTLGALAFRVYNEKIHPVFYISGGKYQGGSSDNSFKRIDEALQTIQRASGSGKSILIIWDGSSYREIESDAKRLLNYLVNRGRRVVLVCSSYAFENEGLPSDSYMVDSSSGAMTRCTETSLANATIRTGCVFLSAVRDMSEQERYAFRQKAANYTGISQAQISYLMKELEGQDIFSHYYRLISLLRKRLEDELESEQTKVARSLQSSMSEYFARTTRKKNDKRKSGPMWQALVKAGLTDEEITGILDTDTDAVDEQHKEDWRRRLARAGTYIAFFSRYKIDLSYSTVFRLMTNDDSTNPYGEDGIELFNTLTSSVPWLVCGKNENGESVFRFRNTIEADIFLERNGIDGKQFIDMTVELLNQYGESYCENGFDDPRMANKLQSILRLLGPNSKYYQAEASPQKEYEHTSILIHLDKLIDAVSKLLTTYHIPDDDQSFSLQLVTLIREYYGKNVWKLVYGRGVASPHFGADGYTPEDYVKRLRQLNIASGRALKSEELLRQRIGVVEPQKREHLRRQANALVVEATLCSLESYELRKQYLNCCSSLGGKPSGDYTGEPQPYWRQFAKLEQVIHTDPLNGYAYNALFALFEQEYQNGRHSEEERVGLLTQVMAIVQDCQLLSDQITNRGDRQDELSTHISSICELADKVPASISSIQNRSFENSTEDSVFLELYDRFLEEGNPAAILFVCRKELKEALGPQEKLSEAARLRCQKVLDFMREPKHIKCIYNDSNALGTLIRVAWMSFSGTQLNGIKWCQTPSLTSEQWRELHFYCDKYAQKAGRSGQRPLLTLLHALATVQIGERSTYSYDRAYAILQGIDEESFGGQYRQTTPFMICDENGYPIQHTGTVRYVKERYGYIDVRGLPSHLGNYEGIHFKLNNLGKNAKTPEKGDHIGGLEVGIGYMGFTLYKEEGRLERVRRA